MGEILLAKYGELALKGLNRGSFEAPLLKTIKRRVATAGEFRVYKAQSTVYIEPQSESCDIGLAALLLSRVFGIAAINRALVTNKNFDEICRDAEGYLGARLAKAQTFKVQAKRADKTFPMDSMELARELGGYLISRFPHLGVSMSEPDITVVIEIRDFGAYLHSGNIPAAGGMPTGTSGRAAVMLSGGIDSPVAAYMMAKRGVELCGVHFMSPPYTSDRALDKVVRLAKKISGYTGNLPLLCVPFTETQLAIRDNAPEDYFTVLMRRSMVRIIGQICQKESCGAIITGESLGQVASQTMDAIKCTDAASSIPILRPLIGMDKTEIIALSRKIDTFDISIEPYEDCCTVFTPKHPKTKPKLAAVEQAENGILHLAELENNAAESYTVKMLHFFD
jgi:thiazole biosynthesis/tRNA modification protein ThiI